MKCICGYDFSKAALEKTRPYKSYALIDDSQYSEFLRAEMKVVKSKDLKDLAKASRYVGSLKTCPRCTVICVSWPDSEMPDSFLVESTAR